MGQSGCGKSTLLHLLGGLLSPTSGEIVIDGEEISKVSDARRTDIRRRKNWFCFSAIQSVSNAFSGWKPEVGPRGFITARVKATQRNVAKFLACFVLRIR